MHHSCRVDVLYILTYFTVSALVNYYVIENAG